MVIFALLAILALVLCAEMERWSLRTRDPQALTGAALCVLALAGAAWCCGGLVR